MSAGSLSARRGASPPHRRTRLRALGEDCAAKILFTPEELARGHRQMFDEMAEEALAAKHS